MTKAKLFLAGIAAAALIPAMASAHERPSTVLNGQVQLGDVIANLNVHAAGTQGGTYSGMAAGNSMTAATEGRALDLRSTQYLHGNVAATNTIAIGQARGATVSSAVAAGNAGQAAACCGPLTSYASQVAEYGSNVTATSHLNLGSADTVASAAQASANSFGISTRHADQTTRTEQYSAANVAASSEVRACCNNDSITSGAVAAGNSLHLTGESSTVYAGAEQKNYGQVTATSRVFAGSATNVTSAASAAGNTISLDNRFGYAQLDGYQENRGFVGATSEVALDNWRGFAVSGSNAIGNSAILSNIGSDATMGMTQVNTGGVSAFTGLYGASREGGVGMATSMAVGNAITGYACNNCAGGAVKLEGYTSQYNAGPVTATTLINAGSVGPLVGSAVAVGNSASFTSATRGH